ncbi:MAG: type II toxin-antitoxin system VapC family toxin [Anaerolineae bacterium]|nr:type II toxin-antitoxin system VapC family toxin [Anaerolineae bacterium]
MSGKYLLDTNVVIALFAGDVQVTDKIKRAEEIFIPSIVIGELYYGAEKSGRVEENFDRVNEFAADNVILNCDTVTGRWYGSVKNQLRQKGRPIPENDLWIAALALQHQLTLVSRDRHFSEAANLKLERW